MAYDYNNYKKFYEAMNESQRAKWTESNKNDADFKDFYSRYTSSTPTTNTTKNQTSNSTNWSNTTYKDSDWYYSATDRNAATWWAEFWSTTTPKTTTNNSNATRVSWTTPTTTTTTTTTTPTTTTNSDKIWIIRDGWNQLTYEQQQEKLKSTPWLKENLIRYGITSKTNPATDSLRYGEWQYKYNPNSWYYEKVGQGTQWGNGTPTNKGGWDYQDNSPERTAEIIRNLDDLSKSNPWLFSDYDTFYNAFIAGKGRSPEQEKVLNDYFNKMKQYNKYDNLSSDELWYLLAHWEPAEDYLSYLKYNDPQRYAEIQEARKKNENQIMNETYLNTVASQAGYEMWDSDFWTWNQEEMWYRDANKDWLDDRLYHAPTEEELKLVDENNQYEQERAKLTDAYKWLQEDLTNQYPDADLSTIMLLTSDRWNKIQRALDTLAVNQTKVQWSLKYLQNERATMDKAWQSTINEIQKQYGMYYDYSPQWIAERAQAQYAATNVTLDQADNGTDTQKQMALDRVLSDYYDKYWSIIQRSKSQVINDVMAYAKKNGVSLSQALEDNFLKFLRQKPWYNQLNTVTANNPNVFKIGDDTYWYWDENWNLIPIWNWVTWTWVGTMRTERNNNPTAMTTDVAKSLWWVEGVDYVQWDSFQTADWKTLYTAKLLGDPIETTIKLLDTAASTWRWAFYTKGWAQRWSHTAMSDAEWLKLTPEEKQNVVLKMLQREGWDISKMAWYNQWWWESTSWWQLYNPALTQIFKQWGDKPDTATAVKDFWNTYWDEIAAAWVSKEDFLKQYDEWYEEQSADAYLEILAHLDQLIELTWWEYDLWERWQSLFGYWDAWRAYDYVKNNLTVNWLRDAKEQWLKLWVLSDSDVKMIWNAATTLSFTQWQKSWNRELNDFREKLLSKNKYLRQRYQNTSAYSPNTSINFSNTDRKFTIWEQNNNNTTKKAKSIKTLWA